MKQKNPKFGLVSMAFLGAMSVHYALSQNSSDQPTVGDLQRQLTPEQAGNTI